MDEKFEYNLKKKIKNLNTIWEKKNKKFEYNLKKNLIQILNTI